MFLKQAKSKIKITIKEILNKKLFKQEEFYYFIEDNTDSYKINEVAITEFKSKISFISEKRNNYKIDKIKSNSFFKKNDNFANKANFNQIEKEKLDSEYLYREIKFDIYNSDNIFQHSFKYDFSKLSFDFCYENFKQRVRFFIYDEFINQNKDNINSYFSLIKKDVKEYKSNENISTIVLTPISFFNYLKFSDNIKIYSLLEHYLISKGKNGVKFGTKSHYNKDSLTNNLEYPILHGLFYLREVEDKLISNNNILEYRNYYIKDKKICFPKLLKSITILDKTDIIENDNIFYEIPWVKIEVNK